MAIPERHVLVCVGKHCRKRGGKKVCKAFREQLDACGLKRRVRVVPVDCLDQCAHGPMALVYPDAVWYAGLEPEDAAAITREHLCGGSRVARKLYKRAHRPPEP
ncbi:MAG TPA: (2Fe-2S) ferredoxin domain-containing protein [Armatimonadota bacterium]|nr:(2Fe-2S) ferredoxin domain-containing protein [Armatimonadota bacterium]